MILQELSILNYKNIEQTNLEFASKINCFIGKNGEGKTNLLDAIYYLSFCKSASNPIDSQIIRHDSEFFMIQGKYIDEDGEGNEVYCGLKRGVKKRFKYNKKEYKKLADHIGIIPLVIISPSDSSLIYGGSEERRKFMDIVISQYNKQYLDSLIRYNKALSQRNALLKQDDELDLSVLSVLEEMMAIEGEYVYECRKSFVEKFSPNFQNIYSQLSGNKETVHLDYVSHCQRGSLLDVIQNGRAKDRIMGFSLHGVHKDELNMRLGEYPIKREGSQGQNKTYLVSLKLAQENFLKNSGNKTKPILLLDDIFDKLDADRVAQIVKLVSGDDFGQIFITDTNREHLDRLLLEINKEYRIFHVEKGNIKE